MGCSSAQREGTEAENLRPPGDLAVGKFRKEIPDSFGGSWVYNWFCVDHIGYTGYNPRKKDIGFHKIFDHYMSYNNKNEIAGDLIQWHFHPLPIVKDTHRSGTAYLNSAHIYEILAKKIIDKNWFPSAYRPGFHTERPDSNWFLEQWIPFDYANQSMKDENNDQPDLAEGRFGDWRRAPKEWKVYHPDHDDYQKEGNCRRWIARCLNIGTRLRVITLDDIRDGFNRANEGRPTLISFSNHDFRDMKPSINKVRALIKQASKGFSDVKFKYSNALDAIRGVIGIEKIDLINPGFDVSIEKNKESAIIKIKSNKDIFGPQPFFAIKTKSEHYIWQNLDFQEKNNWSFTFDYNTIDLASVDKIGIAANTKNGVAEIINYDSKKEIFEKTILNK